MGKEQSKHPGLMIITSRKHPDAIFIMDKDTEQFHCKFYPCPEARERAEKYIGALMEETK